MQRLCLLNSLNLLRLLELVVASHAQSMLQLQLRLQCLLQLRVVRSLDLRNLCLPWGS